MSKLTDFYQKAKIDGAIKAELAGVTKGYIAGVIATAAKHGVTLEAADFASSSGALDDDALADVAGGGHILYKPDVNKGKGDFRY
jgi:hypothetical protein